MIARTLVLSAALAAPALCGGGEERPFTGAFQGTGRACYGGLFVRTKTLSWLTPFSQCQKLPYETIDRKEQGRQRQFAFRLKQRTKACQYEVLYLYHGDSPDPDIDWHVIGYSSLAEYEADRQNGFKADSPNALACALVTR